MKILTASQIHDLDKYTIKHEPIASVDLMERAAAACAKWIHAHYPISCVFNFFCGLGNNGGDGLALARLLHQMGYTVKVCIAEYSDKFSTDFTINLNRLKEINTIKIIEINEVFQFPEIHQKDIIIDAILGSGLSRSVNGLLEELVIHINKSEAQVIAIDIPSGLFSDIHSDPKSAIIKADYTLSFEVPKLAFMFSENDDFVGEWKLLPIGLHRNGMASIHAKNNYLTNELINKIVKPRRKFSHKGTYGHALLVAGAVGKIGAAVLASKACLRGGVGLLTTHVPTCGYEILQISVPEAMLSIDSSEIIFSSHLNLMPYTAVGIGPGIGVAEETQKALKLFIQSSSHPIVIDADALNIVSENKTWLSFIPPNSILTPHQKEFERLVGKAADSFERQQMQINFAVKYKVYVVLKGAHTAIACPDGTCYYNSTGNPGMATGGSGDVLTGIILSLLAQNYTPIEASLLGVYLHGLSGDIALEKQSIQSIIASDLIENIGAAYKKCTKK